MQLVHRIALGVAATAAIGSMPARAQWLWPHYETLGVTAKGDTTFQYGVAPAMIAHTNLSNGVKPKVFWPAGGSRYTTVAFEFPWLEPGDICELPEYVELHIPLAAPYTPSATIALALRAYAQGTDGVLDAATVPTLTSGPFHEDVFYSCSGACPDGDGDGRGDVVATLTLTAGVPVTSLDFDVRWNYSRDRLNQGAGPFFGFLLDRRDTAPDGQTLTLENGGAVIDFGAHFGGCPVPEIWGSPATCFTDFGNGNWVAVEFMEAHYDWSLGGYAVGGVLLPSDPASGVLGCDVTQYPAGAVTGVTNFSPSVTGAVVAAYEVDLSGLPLPVSATNPIRVSIGYQGFPQEQDKEQQLLLFHAPNGVSAVNVTEEARSNRKGNLDGGWLQSSPRTSASPFILAFAADVADCGAVVADAFAPPMGSTKKIGSKLPLKLRLALGDAALGSLADFAAAGLPAPSVRIYDITNGAAFVAERALTDTGAKWTHELDLAPSLFVAGHTYEARVQIGACAIVPANARFQTR